MGEDKFKFIVDPVTGGHHIAFINSNGTTSRIGMMLASRSTARIIVDWLNDRGAGDALVAHANWVDADTQPKADAGEGLTGEEIAIFREILAVGLARWRNGLLPIFANDTDTDLFLEIIAERRAAKARAAAAAAKLAEPEGKRTWDQIVSEVHRRLEAGETVVIPARYPGHTWGETRSIASSLRQIWIYDKLAGRLHDPHAHKPDPDTLVSSKNDEKAPSLDMHAKCSCDHERRHHRISTDDTSCRHCSCIGFWPFAVSDAAPAHLTPIVADAATGSEDDDSDDTPSTPDRDPSTGIADAMRATHTGATRTLDGRPRQPASNGRLA